MFVWSLPLTGDEATKMPFLCGEKKNIFPVATPTYFLELVKIFSGQIFKRKTNLIDLYF